MNDTDNDNHEYNLQSYEYDFKISEENQNESFYDYEYNNWKSAGPQYQNLSDNSSVGILPITENTNKDSEIESTTNMINLIKSLRLEQVILLSRKDDAMNMLMEQYKNKKREPEIPKKEGTVEEVRNYYENLILKFRDNKSMWFSKILTLKDKMKLLTEHLDSERTKCDELINRQHKLELETALTMINPQTNKMLNRDEIEKMIKNSEEKHKWICILYTKQITMNKAIKKLEKSIRDIQSSSGYDFLEYQKTLQEVLQLKILLKDIQKNNSNIRNVIMNMLQLNEDVHNKEEELKMTKKKKDIELNNLKEHWKNIVTIKAYNTQKVIKRQKNINPDWFNNQLLLDYHKNVEKSQTNQAYEVELQKILSEYKIKIDNYFIEEDKIPHKLNDTTTICNL